MACCALMGGILLWAAQPQNLTMNNKWATKFDTARLVPGPSLFQG